MHTPLVNLNDKWLRIIGIGSIVLVNVFINQFLRQSLTGLFVLRLLVTVTAITIIWHVNRFIIFRFRQKYIKRLQPLLRLTVTFGVGVAVTTLMLWVANLTGYLLKGKTVYEFINASPATLYINKQKFTLSFYGADFFQATTTFLLFLAIYESLFFAKESREANRRLQQAEREKEALEKANLHSQLEALKQQVNPHFLFNSLNSLISLIGENPAQAERFAEELSTVYRYLLRSNEQNLTPLATELEFIQSYYHLLQTRHGAGLNLVVQVDKQFEKYQLPPLTLQLLVENAVKHNMILAEKPLTVEITTDAANRLIVRNTLQRKNGRVVSNGVGLSNILTKYRVLGQPAPQVQEDNGQFVVTLPLVEQPG
ncbi:hypothetical protein GCM10023189_20340 [Nibrella saemangeumensis]|uniref:Signal transduction histidine kinase internal region domain-containing protein n=1 Tax=Nibrella saemangeumensis TaxID=1084526 RepID=A0ABP8MT55_9BACT